MPICPNGHQSGSDEWCEVCGHRMGGAAAPPPPAPPAPGYGYPPPGPAPAPELCPQCQTPRESNAPFCEECRWNFLTNTATSYTPLAPRTTAGQGPGGGVNLPPGFQTQPSGEPFGSPPPQQAPRPRDPYGARLPEAPPAAGGPYGARPPQPPYEARPPEPPYGTRPPEPPYEGRPPEPPYEATGTRPSQINRPAEPLVSEPAPGLGAEPADDGWGAPRPPRFERASPPAPAPTGGGDWTPAPPLPPSFDRVSPPPAPTDDDWTLPPPSQEQPFPPRQDGERPGVPAQGTQGGADPQQPRFPATTRWAVVIGPDREYFMAMMHRSGPEATGLNLPAYSPEQHMPLTGNQVTIGRRRHSTGEAPDIDLSVPPEDPGVSHQHALLVQQPDGGWAVVDQNSTNGTTLNGGEEPIQPYVPIPLGDGDRVHVGAWTTIRIVQDET